jgi:hypothetical protein
MSDRPLNGSLLRLVGPGFRSDGTSSPQNPACYAQAAQREEEHIRDDQRRKYKVPKPHLKSSHGPDQIDPQDEQGKSDDCRYKKSTHGSDICIPTQSDYPCRDLQAQPGYGSGQHHSRNDQCVRHIVFLSPTLRITRGGLHVLLSIRLLRRRVHPLVGHLISTLEGRLAAPPRDYLVVR